MTQYIHNDDETITTKTELIANNSHIFVAFAEPQSHHPGSDDPDVASPQVQKTVTPQLDGTQKITLEVIPAVTYCGSCEKTYPTVQYGRTCPHCGSGETWLLTGNECTIKEIEAE